MKNYLKWLDSRLLRHRRIRGDVFEVYKLVLELYDGSSRTNSGFFHSVHIREINVQVKPVEKEVHYD